MESKKEKQPRPTRPAETTQYGPGRKQDTTPKVIVQPERVPRSRTFVAKPCVACKAIRETAGDTENYTRVFATRGNVRYCKCHYCGHTWKDAE